MPALLLVGWLTAGWWLPGLSALAFGADSAADAAGEDPHAGHDHGVAAAGEVVRLSDQARGTIGLRTAEVRLTDFDRAVTVPGVVTQRPGRSDLQVSAPMTGVITDVFVTEGQAVRPGDPLFVMRLTHEDIVRAQTEFLKTLEALDVEEREIARLRNVSGGVVAGKVVLEREYEKQKLEGLLKAQREALRLHGLEEAQVARIASDRSLVREIRILVPEPHDPAEPGHDGRHDLFAREAVAEPRTPSAGVSARRISLQDAAGSEVWPPLTVERLTAHAGDAVSANAPLAELSDLSLLYVEGRAFERDAAAVAAAAREDRRVTALPTDNLAGPSDPVAGLEIAFVANRVTADSRVLPFYVLLPNEVASDRRQGSGGERFLTWKYKPGQRMRLRVPVETFREAIVLPVEAVAEAGAERYAFVENGATFERRPVRVLYRDAESVVIADDGSLLPGESVAVSAAHQLQMALKNAAGGAVDPHAGHNH
ncbi:efflux RND transporter periplasmic adaptor subunit [Alienimonas sp. DA493]|uniref:efflux RND transporter periplasmic adaptor subunit n=1 Tax=Alienimonas sp. DA493 TaxID=3373605 RepID=UPI00375424E5